MSEVAPGVVGQLFRGVGRGDGVTDGLPLAVATEYVDRYGLGTEQAAEVESVAAAAEQRAAVAETIRRTATGERRG